MQSHFLASSTSTTTILPHKQPPPKPGQGQGQQQLVPITVMNSTIRAGRHGGEGGTGEQGEPKQSAGGAKKSRAFTGDSPHPPHRPDESEQTLPSRVNDTDDDNDIFVDSSRTPQDKVESKGEEGAPATAPVAKKRRASNPYCPGCCGTLLFSSFVTTTPRTFPRAQPSSSRSGYRGPAKRRHWGRVQDI